MATRMQVRGVKGVVANGRIRDLRELRGLDFPVRLLLRLERAGSTDVRLDICKRNFYGWDRRASQALGN